MSDTTQIVGNKSNLLSKLLKARKNEPICNECENLLNVKGCFYCKVKDKIIMAEYPPNKCEYRESGEKHE